MRKKRVVLFDDESIILDVMTMFFEEKGYDVLAFQEPVICPIYYGPHDCKMQHACSDIMLTDYNMPRMNGLSLLREQIKRGCKLTPKNKALMTGLGDDDKQREVEGLGVTFFRKPLEFSTLATWVSECEKRIDLSTPLGLQRREPRSDCREEVTYQAPTYYAPASGLAVNLSPSGMCLLLSTLLPREQRVRLHSDMLGVSQTAAVRWTRQVNEGQYMAGLQYVL